MRVLLADHKVWLRSALRLLLEDEANVEVVGEVIETRTLPLFVERLRPDLLFLDWQLPGLTTNSARRQILDTMHAINPELYIIALINDDNAEMCILLGADACISKAEPPEQIVAVLRLAANGRLKRYSQAACHDQH